MITEKWKSQIARGTLEYCILIMLNKKAYYGYEVLQKLKQFPMLSSTESTVYPLLRRLEKEEFLHSFWQNATAGLPPRKYYELTAHGREYLHALNTEWRSLLEAMSDLRGE